jgi:hypothetical protein
MLQINKLYLALAGTFLIVLGTVLSLKYPLLPTYIGAGVLYCLGAWLLGRGFRNRFDRPMSTVSQIGVGAVIMLVGFVLIFTTSFIYGETRESIGTPDPFLLGSFIGGFLSMVFGMACIATTPLTDKVTS